MRFDRMRLATKLWTAMGVMVAVLAIIIAFTASQFGKNREAYGQVNEAMLEKIRSATQWARLVDVNMTRAYAVVVAVDNGVATAFKDEIAQSNKATEELQTKIEALELSDADKAKIAEVTEARKKVNDLTSQTALLKVTKPDEMPDFIAKQYRPAVQALQKAHQEFVELQDKASDEQRRKFEGDSSKLIFASAFSLIVMIGGILVGAGFLIRSIKRPLLAANELAARIAEGDLSGDVDESRSDEFGDLMRSLGAMNQSLGLMVSQVRNSTDSIATAPPHSPRSI
ncbi:MAG: HAMP domain-containing protein [Rhodoferax sp.]